MTFKSSDAPLSIGRVTLTVNDLTGMSDFYARALGLEKLQGDAVSVTLGAGDKPLLVLNADPHARRSGRTEAGLFHTAFLLPSRADLGAWLNHAGATNIRLTGAADHTVSEAVYLDDPEGNGIEVYADNPDSVWARTGDASMIGNARLDYDGIVESAKGDWIGAPADTIVGHVHLRVGDQAGAEAFFKDDLGMDLVVAMPGASFLATGGYHHHIGANTWNSRGAGARNYPSTGLAEVELLARPSVTIQGETRIDPNGTMFRIRNIA